MYVTPSDAEPARTGDPAEKSTLMLHDQSLQPPASESAKIGASTPASAAAPSGPTRITPANAMTATATTSHEVRLVIVPPTRSPWPPAGETESTGPR